MGVAADSRGAYVRAGVCVCSFPAHRHPAFRLPSFSRKPSLPHVSPHALRTKLPPQNQIPVFCTQLPKLQTQLPSPTGGHHFQFLCSLAPQLPSSYYRCISAPQLPSPLLLAIPPTSAPTPPQPAGRGREESGTGTASWGRVCLAVPTAQEFSTPELLNCSTIS